MSWLKLTLLAALWGGSFLFLRICAPVMGPMLLIFLRVVLAAVFLMCAAGLLRRKVRLRGLWRHFFIVGVFNSALPFALFAYAAMSLPASLLSILNASAPIWAALLWAAVSRETLSKKSVLGLALGSVGVAVLVGLDASMLEPVSYQAVAAGLAAACSYGIATTYTKKAQVAVDPLDNALGSMLAATLVLLPLAFWWPMPDAPWDAKVWVSALLLGVVSTGWAYLLYFRLVQDLGPSAALTVTFLIPLFGIVWGVLFLEERVGWHTLWGGAAVLAGTALASGFSWPRALGRQRV
ncbi:MAG: DMT family transporter [Pseudomonadota bacterium]